MDIYNILKHSLKGVLIMIGRRLKELRKQNKKTQDEIADKLKISRARYSHYENDRHEPDTELIRKIADMYQTTVDYIMGLTNSPSLKESAHSPALEAILDDELLDEETKRLALKLKSLSPEQQKIIDSLIEQMKTQH
ncbi:XRE family transcriptional regulator (plasmid) [Brevibacillus laterosporus]|nr:XRE family transcriptional regulator [Brevibacillus laterosporus]